MMHQHMWFTNPAVVVIASVVAIMVFPALMGAEEALTGGSVEETLVRDTSTLDADPGLPFQPETSTGAYLILDGENDLGGWEQPSPGNDPNLVNPDEVDRSAVEVIHAKAEIDGRSRLVFRGNTVRWDHHDFNPPGLWGPEEEPTEINGAKWFPKWGRVHSSTPIRSDMFQLPAFLPPRDAVFAVDAIEAPGSVRIAEQPSAGNGYSLAVEFEQRGGEGTSEYTVCVSDDVGSATYSVDTWIEGRMRLVFAGNTARLVRYDCPREGALDEVRPTMINESIWYPAWSREDVSRLCEGRTEVFTGLTPPLPAKPLDVTVGVIQGRGAVRVIEEPSEQNEFTLIVEFNDNPQGGAVIYEIEIYYPK